MRNKKEKVIGKTLLLKMDDQGNVLDNSKRVKNITAKDVDELLKKCKRKRQDIKTLLSDCATIAKAAFEDCSGLTKIKLDNCKEIQESSFINCSELEKVYLPKCKNFGENTFSGCIKVRSVTLKDTTDEHLVALFPDSKEIQKKHDTTEGRETVYLKIDKMGYITDNKECLRDITVEDIEEIAPDKESVTGVFSKCKTIDDIVFRKCKKLKKVKLPNCTEIGDQAFCGCVELERFFAPKLAVTPKNRTV